MEFVYIRWMMFTQEEKERNMMGIVIKKLSHPYTLPTKITIKMREAKFL